MRGGEVGTSLSNEEKEILKLYQATILHLLVNIHTQQVEGAMLVFLPGYEDISIVMDLIGSQPLLSRDTSVVVLYSQVASGEHRKAFQTPPKGKRKVVVATNVA